ncbi:MAG: PxKF domain-containing protein [Pedococcus sp.]
MSGATIAGGSGTATVGGLLYAKQGASLTLTATTDTDTRCVDVVDAGGTVQAQLTSNSARTSWAFTTAAFASLVPQPGNGVVTYTLVPWKNLNAQGKCTNDNSNVKTVSYVLDNTGPVLTPLFAPTLTGNWTSNDTTVTWTAVDPNVAVGPPATPGSGFATQPTASTTYTTSGVYALTAPAFTDRLGNAATGSGTLRLDKAAPSITGTRTPAANAFGWNNSSVTVSFACQDLPATNASGLAAPGCPAATVVGSATDPTKDVTGGSVTGTVSDVAGNSSSATVSNLNVDTVSPALTGAATTSPNGNGWYRDDVTVHWNSSDARSGLDPATTPGDVVLTGEGSALTVSASVSDKAGNTKTAVSTAVKIDRTAPVTAISGTSNDWTNAGLVAVTLTPVDALSQVATTTFAVDGGASQTGTSFTLGDEGDHTITYSSTDKAGNVEATRTAHVKIDRTAPSIGHGFTPSSYTDSAWTNAAKVVVTFACSDAGSGVASCTPPVDVTAEGAAQAVTGTAKDTAGNTATDTASVSIDRTAPSVVAVADRSPNGNGWFSDDVTVSFTCTDQAALSGVKTCSASRTLGQGADQSATGTAVDVAGNTASATLDHLDVDKTAPVLTGAPTSAPNAAGWYDNSVVIHWTCSDALSGIDGPCPADSTVSGEGSNLGASASVSDRAGNTRTAAVTGLKIDSTTPVTSGSVSDPLATGWYADKSRVTLTGTDNLSGVAKTWYVVDGGAATAYAGAFDYATPGVHTITFWSLDAAGNVEDSTAPGHSVTVKIDGIKPSISGSATPTPNLAGWNNTDVTVAFTCSDAESGIASCPEDSVLSLDGAAQYVTGTATDHGGNSDSATVGPVNVDQTKPNLTGAATTSPNANDWYNGDVTAHWTATDATSGVDPATAPGDSVVTGEGAALTAGPVQVSDFAANTRSTTLTGVKIDRTKPTISGAPTTAPNAAGWYRGNVGVDWTCSDALSGIEAGTCPATSTIASEGSNLSATASVADRADNGQSATVSGVKIDRTAPNTDISAPSGWTNEAVTMAFTASDNLSGVAATYYSVNGADAVQGSSVTFTNEGEYDLEVWSVDVAGNRETAKSATVLIDKSAPTITHGQSPAANGNGWNNTDVRVTFTCDDTGGSGLASCTSPVDVTTEGKQIPVPGTALDHAGNSATDPATVSIDTSAPTISGALDRAANANGWYRAPVTVTFTCADQALLSGVASCPAPVTRTEGANQSATGTAKDAADNSASATVTNIDVDTSAPLLSGEATTAPNAAGWYRSDVSVAWTCSDALSGIDGECPTPSTVTSEGADQSATATVLDRAGNDTTASVTGLQIDRTAPATAPSVRDTDSDNGWYATAPTVTLKASDSLSTVASTWYRVDGGSPQAYTGPFTQSLEGIHTVTFWSVDKAGNVEDQDKDVNTITVRVDTTAPGITGSRTPAANAFGWNNGPVVVSFECTDSGGSGVCSCTDPTTLDDQGADQAVTGHATDAVGNTASATVGDIDIDVTDPALSGAATTSPNAAGWYRGDVVVHWTCSDALSGIAGSCPADSTVDGEGNSLAAYATVSDKAGNDASATVAGLKIDRKKPVTSVTTPSDWQREGVTLAVQASDNLSGVAETFYTVNGGTPQAGASIELGSDGVYELAFWSVDVAGNEGVHGTATIKVDQTAPSVSHTITPEPNGDLWNNSDATVHFICDDATSTIASCTPDRVVSTEAAGTNVVGTAVDVAGNAGTDTAIVNLDKTKPTIAGTTDRSPNGNGWYDADVTVSFTCADTLSGVASCQGASTLSEGADQSVIGSAADKAGNTRSATVSDIDVDKTRPVLTGAVTTAPNGTGWYRGDVVVHWTCSDVLSGIAGSCPQDSTVSGEGDNLSASAVVSDKAGNSASATVSGLKIDRTDPVTQGSVPASPYSTGWYDAPVTVTLSATDDRSGVAATRYTVDGGSVKTYADPFTVGAGVHTVTWWSTDTAGNVEDRTADGHTLTVKVDNLAPTISGAPTTSSNANGWYAGPVTVHFVCADAQTAVAGVCGPDRTLTGDGANQSVVGTVKDKAGNTASATVGSINIDQTKPVFAAYAGTTAYTVGQTVVEPTCGTRASDALSGLASCVLTSRTGSALTNPNGVGDRVYTFTATDKAGNAATQVVTLHIGYGWSGFLQPVTNTAHDLGSASTFKAGSTVPMKFVLKDANGAVRQASYAPLWLAPVDLGTTSAGTGLATGDAGTVGGSYKGDGGQYVFTWQTPKSGAGHYYRVGVQVDSGDVYTTLIRLS